MKGKAFSKLKKFVESESFYDKALEIDPNNPDLWNGKGEALTNLRRYQEAIECFDKALSIQPNWESWRSKGEALTNLRRYQEAIECFDKALEITPTSFNKWNLRALALFMTGKYEEAKLPTIRRLKSTPIILTYGMAKAKHLRIRKKMMRRLNVLIKQSHWIENTPLHG